MLWIKDCGAHFNHFRIVKRRIEEDLMNRLRGGQKVPSEESIAVVQERDDDDRDHGGNRGSGKIHGYLNMDSTRFPDRLD